MLRLFKHYIPKSLILLGLLELLLFMGALKLGTYWRVGSDGIVGLSEKLPYLPETSLIFSLLMLTAMTASGLYQRHLRDGLNGMFLRITVAFVFGFLGMVVVFYIFPDIFLGRGAMAMTFAISAVGVLSLRLVYVKLIDQAFLKRRLLVIGAGERALPIEQRLKRRTDREHFTIVGFYSLPLEEVAITRERVFNNNENLMDLVRVHDVDEIIVAITERRKGFPVDDILDCKLGGIEVVDVLSFFERQTGRVVLDILNPSWLIFSDGFIGGNMRAFGKRAFDIAASLLLLTLTLPVMIVTALMIWLGDRGPIFYRQVRVGQDWNLIKLTKFRSMKIDAEKNGAQFAVTNDNRVTRVGRFIRKTRIDELPQLVNVLKGDMSFVGPRPERPEFVEKFSDNIPYYSERHRVKPGITGWAQICYPYGSTEKDTVEKLQYDLYYVKNYSLFLDLMVLFQTAEVVLWGKGAR